MALSILVKKTEFDYCLYTEGNYLPVWPLSDLIPKNLITNRYEPYSALDPECCFCIFVNGKPHKAFLPDNGAAPYECLYEAAILAFNLVANADKTEGFYPYIRAQYSTGNYDLSSFGGPKIQVLATIGFDFNTYKNGGYFIQTPFQRQYCFSRIDFSNTEYKELYEYAFNKLLNAISN